MLNFVFLALGVALLTVGGEALIRGALSASRRLGVSPLLSGLVIVGFGTSAPELVVSVDAALHQRPDIAIGNVVGSNIGNILLILGICALIAPLAVKPLALRRDAVAVVAASILLRSERKRRRAMTSNFLWHSRHLRPVAVKEMWDHLPA